mgnify:CR=1 FL=1
MGYAKRPIIKADKENTLRTYAKRDISKKFAQSIVYKLSPEMFIESLESRPKAVLALLADDYKSYDPTATVGISLKSWQIASWRLFAGQLGLFKKSGTRTAEADAAGI